MKQTLINKGKEAFGQIAKHKILYSNVSWKDYFWVSPLHYIIFRILNFLQSLFMNKIINLKNLGFFVAVNKYIIEKKLGPWPEGPNLIILKMENLKRMWKEVILLEKILRRINAKLRNNN